MCTSRECDMMNVWIIETGEYEQAYIVGVAATWHAAVESIKGRYGRHPYIVRWDDPDISDGSVGLVGHFSAVPGYSTMHDASYSITRYEVHGRVGGDQMS